MQKQYFLKNNKQKGYTRLVDFGDAISSRTKSASPKLTTGYTIIETMIAIAVFLIVVTIGMGALLNTSLINKKSQDMRSLMDSLSFIMEDMSKNLRTGYNYHCGDGTSSTFTAQDCIDGNNFIAFESATTKVDVANTNNQWIYKIRGQGILSKSTDGGNTFSQLNPSEIEFDSASTFVVTGAKNTDFKQPFVTIRLIGKIRYRGVDTPFNLQTSVSQRVLDR